MTFEYLRRLNRPKYGWDVECYLAAKEPLKTHTIADDALCGGLMPGLTILGGVASAGKSSLAVHIATEVAESGKRVIYFTLDDTWGNITARSMSCWSVKNQGLKRQGLTVVPFEWSTVIKGPGNELQLPEGLQNLSAYAFNARHSNTVLADAAIYEDMVAPNLAIIDNIATTTQIEEIVRTVMADGDKPDLVIIDYIQQYQTGTPDIDKQEYTRVSQVATNLQMLAFDTQIPFLVLSSLKKLDAKDEPSLDWFRGSGVVGYASWAALILTKGEIDTPQFKEVALHTVKNKAGRTGILVPAKLKGAYSTFIQNGGVCIA